MRDPSDNQAAKSTKHDAWTTTAGRFDAIEDPSVSRGFRASDVVVDGTEDGPEHQDHGWIHGWPKTMLLDELEACTAPGGEA